MSKKPHIVYRWDELRLSSGNPILHNSFRHTRELRLAICSNALRATTKTLMNPKDNMEDCASIFQRHDVIMLDDEGCHAL